MNKRFILIIFLVLVTKNVECEKNKYLTFNARLAKYLVDYFHLERFETLSEDHDDSITNFFQKCSSVDTIEDYFFKVYGSESDETNFTINALDDLIHYHLRKSRKTENEVKHMKYRCNRKSVINNILVLAFINEF